MHSHWVPGQVNLVEAVFTYLVREVVTLSAAAKSRQLCPTLCDPIDGSLTGSPVPGILQARTLEWVAISFCNAWKWSRSVVSDSSRPHGPQPTRLLRPWDFPGKSTGVGCHCLLRTLYNSTKLPARTLPTLGNLMATNFTLCQLDGDYGIIVLLRLFQNRLQMTRSFRQSYLKLSVNTLRPRPV